MSKAFSFHSDYKTICGFFAMSYFQFFHFIKGLSLGCFQLKKVLFNSKDHFRIFKDTFKAQKGGMVRKTFCEQFIDVSVNVI